MLVTFGNIAEQTRLLVIIGVTMSRGKNQYCTSFERNKGEG